MPSTVTMNDHGINELPQAPSATTTSSTPPGEIRQLNRMRRQVIWACVWGYLGVNFLMFLRFFFPRVLFEPNTIVNIGSPSDFRVDVSQKFLNSNRIWVVKEPERLFVIYARCTHLGCTPDWLPQNKEFHCPCHGSEYDSEGINFAGPAPRPMDRCHVELDATGQIIVDTSRLYTNDSRSGVNHFDDPGAYLSV